MNRVHPLSPDAGSPGGLGRGTWVSVPTVHLPSEMAQGGPRPSKRMSLGTILISISHAVKLTHRIFPLPLSRGVPSISVTPEDYPTLKVVFK